MKLLKFQLAAVALISLVALGAAHAQTFKAEPAAADGTATPVLTWDMPGYVSCVASGAWSGTKAVTGTQTLAAVVNNTAAPIITTYTLTCAGAGTATLSWTPPTQNVDGTTLTNLAKYRIFHSTTEATLGAESIEVPAPASSYVVRNLPPGLRFFAMKSVNSAGAESPTMSVAVSKTIVGTQSIRSVTVTVNPSKSPPKPPSALTVIDQVAYDVRRRYFGLFGPYELNNRVGVVPLGSACGTQSVQGLNTVDRALVSYTRSPKSSIVVARCALT